ncbi:hypothetical protein [Sorangium sp. So ce1153]|uniref:hypothetical protein n=1 Tax=Sorangium sp. So ce1153 TaxID=3133333 RepID=UPI003F5D5C09
MHNVRSDIDESKNAHEDPGHEQFPVDTRVITKIRLATDGAGGDLVRIVVMNDQTTPQRSPFREYHHGNTGISIDSITSLTMQADRTEGTQQAIDSFVGAMPLHLDLSQSASWCCGVYSPSESRKRLYKATDPDDSTKMIGLLVEQDAQGKLAKITWYKTQAAKALFSSTPGELSFELVKDENGLPSLDPNDIGGWTWYYTTSVCSGS